MLFCFLAKLIAKEVILVDIIESFILGKNKNQLLCEDKIFIGRRFIAIIDGATSSNNQIFDGDSSGLSAAKIIHKSLSKIEEGNLFTQQNSEYKICNYITQQFNSFYLNHNIDYKKNPTQRIVASTIIYDSLEHKIIMVGDCQALALGDPNIELKLVNEKKIDSITSNTRSLFISTLIELNNATVESLLEFDLGRQYIEPLLKNQLSFQNKECLYGYGCFDGIDIPRQLIEIIQLEKNINKIILCSDGYPSVFKTLKESEQYLRQLKISDPLLYQIHKSTKGFMNNQNSFDDRAYISFKVQ